MLTEDDLLLGPRGRGVCMAVACQLHEDLWSAWLQTAWYPGDESRRGVLLSALAAVDPVPVCAWQDPLIFLEPMDKSVTSAMYWQPPHETDIVLTDPQVVAALRPVAAAVAAAPAAAWWSTPADTAALRYTSLFDGDEASPPLLTGARERLSGWRDRTLADEADAAAHRPADPAAPYSGHWWSTPALASLVTTTRPLAGLGSVALAWQEDSAGQRHAAIWPVATTDEPRVWEIDRPDAWTRLVERYPLEATHARRHDWYKTTGRTGIWYIPDWSAAAADWDAVHLTVAGYLTTATRALPLADGASATVLAGWDPDQSWWLTDTLTTTSPHPEFWHNPGAPGGPGFAWQRTAR